MHWQHNLAVATNHVRFVSRGIFSPRSALYISPKYLKNLFYDNNLALDIITYNVIKKRGKKVAKQFSNL